ncbi:MAG: two-component system response regulator [Deltaproteobacteria bacterium]
MARKVLIIDDDREFLGELKELLVLSGYEVNAIEDSTKAFMAAARSKPDVILLDLKMKKMSGFDVLDKLRNSPSTGSIPVIIISGFFSEERDFPLLRFFNVKNYLQKPLPPLHIIRKIEAAANMRGQSVAP